MIPHNVSKYISILFHYIINNIISVIIIREISLLLFLLLIHILCPTVLMQTSHTSKLKVFPVSWLKDKKIYDNYYKWYL